MTGIIQAICWIIGIGAFITAIVLVVKKAQNE